MHRIFPSLSAKFKGDAWLKRIGRELYHALEGEPFKDVLPNVEVTNTTSHDDWDTFDTDETVFNLTFTVRAKQAKGVRTAEIMQAIQRVYGDSRMIGGEFTTSGFTKGTTDGPFLRDGIYIGTVTLNLHVTWKNLTPSARAR